MRFEHILLIMYFVFSIIWYPYLKSKYFPHSASFSERVVIMILAIFWLISVPVTYLLKQEEETITLETSYDGFVGREA